jgi:hypothetical protein
MIVGNKKDVAAEGFGVLTHGQIEGQAKQLLVKLGREAEEFFARQAGQKPNAAEQGSGPTGPAQPSGTTNPKDSDNAAPTINIQNLNVITGNVSNTQSLVLGDNGSVSRETPTVEKTLKKTVAAIVAFLAQLLTCSGWLKPIKALFHWLGF